MQIDQLLLSPFFRRNRRKYNLKIPIVPVTKYRKGLLTKVMDKALKQECVRIAETHDGNSIARERDADHIHILLDTTP